jgi:hypothetical protein
MSIFTTKKKAMIYKNFFLNKKRSVLSNSKQIYDFFFKERTGVNSNIYISDAIFKKSPFFNEKKTNINNFFNEIRINRVRFKPGYQRLWRNYRIALSDSISYKYTYQKQLTFYITKFYRKLNQDYLSSNDNVAYKIIIYSKLVPDRSTFNIFLRNNLIFLNSSLLKSTGIFLYKNDFVQLEVSNWYYIFYR